MYQVSFKSIMCKYKYFFNKQPTQIQLLYLCCNIFRHFICFPPIYSLVYCSILLEEVFFLEVLVCPKLRLLLPALLGFLGEKTNFERSTLCMSEG